MLNQSYGHRKLKLMTLLGLSLLLVTVLGLSVGSGVSVATAAPANPLTGLEKALPPAQQGENANEDTYEFPAINPAEAAEDRRVLFNEMTLVQLLEEQYGFVQTACAGSGLNNIQPLAGGPMVLIPNAGDLSIDGSNVAIRLDPNGDITFIPRTQGQMIGIITSASSDAVEIKEVPNLTLAEAEPLIATGRLVWTAKGQGPYGNGQGLPGHIASCDPLYDKQKFEDYQQDQDES